MRMSILGCDGLIHHITRMWSYAATLHGSLACGATWPPHAREDVILEKPATCLWCAISPRAARDTVYTNEDA